MPDREGSCQGIYSEKHYMRGMIDDQVTHRHLAIASVEECLYCVTCCTDSGKLDGRE